MPDSSILYDSVNNSQKIYSKNKTKKLIYKIPTTGRRWEISVVNDCKMYFRKKIRAESWTLLLNEMKRNHGAFYRIYTEILSYIKMRIGTSEPWTYMGYYFYKQILKIKKRTQRDYFFKLFNKYIYSQKIILFNWYVQASNQIIIFAN